MKNALLGLMAIAVLTAAAFAADTPTQAIEKRASEFAAAWNRHDSNAMAALWLPDGDMYTPFGRWAKGHEEVTKLFADEQSTFMKATTFTLDAVAVRTPKPDVAVSDWDLTITGITAPDGSVMGPQKFHATMVWLKKGSTWSILAGRPVLLAPQKK